MDTFLRTTSGAHLNGICPAHCHLHVAAKPLLEWSSAASLRSPPKPCPQWSASTLVGNQFITDIPRVSGYLGSCGHAQGGLWGKQWVYISEPWNSNTCLNHSLSIKNDCWFRQFRLNTLIGIGWSCRKTCLSVLKVNVTRLEATSRGIAVRHVSLFWLGFWLTLRKCCDF